MPSINLRFVATLAVAAGLLSAGLVNASGPRPECVDSYKTQSTDSCSSISAWSGVTVAEIKALNPGLTTCNAPLNLNTVCLRSFTPSCTKQVPATAKTCNSLAAAWQITVDQFVQLNDNVDNACDNLVVGQQYCVSDVDCYPGNTEPLCCPNYPQPC